MREQAQLWIGASNREEAMARVLSRSDLPEGTVLHAHRAASSSLIAIFAENGWAYTSGRCADLCDMLEAHNVIATRDVIRAAETLDQAAQKLNLNIPGEVPEQSCDAPAGADCLECAKRVRGFVNTVLTR